MTIKELKSSKNELEARILDLVTQFQARTGFPVDHIHLLATPLCDPGGEEIDRHQKIVVTITI